jgi:hypothetical protein
MRGIGRILPATRLEPPATANRIPEARRYDCPMANDNGFVGRLAAGAGGVALVVSVFVPWYSLSLTDVLRSAVSQEAAGPLSGVMASVTGPTFTWSGWDGLHVIRFVLLLVGVAGVAMSLAQPAEGMGDRRLLLVAGLLAATVAGYRIASPPGTLDIALGPLRFPTPAGGNPLIGPLIHVAAGGWVALLGGVLVMLGGWAGPRRSRAPAPIVAPALTVSEAPPGR